MSQQIRIVKKTIYYKNHLVHQHFKFMLDGELIDTWSSRRYLKAR